MKPHFPLLFSALAVLSTSTAQDSGYLYLRSVSSYTPYNHLYFGGVGSSNPILHGGLQPAQTYPVGGKIVDTILWLLADSSDPGPAYFIHRAAGTEIELDVFGIPQAGYGISSKSLITFSGKLMWFYACRASLAVDFPIFYSKGGNVPKGCHALNLEAVPCDSSSCALDQ